MTRSIRTAVTAVLWSVLATVVASAAPNDFYTALLQRGISHVAAGNYEAGTKELRTAAFGLVDDLPLFETAQVYLTIAGQKLNHEADARHAAQRVLAAERIEQHYGTLSLPADVRANFEHIAAQILTSDQIAVLHARPVAPITPHLPAPITPPPVAPIVVQQPAPGVAKPVAPIVVPPTPQPQTGKPIISHPAPSLPIELPPAAPREQVDPPTRPTGPRVTAPPKQAPIVIPPPAPVPVPVVMNADELSRRLDAADSALGRNDLAAARTIYREAVDVPGLDHATAMRIGEGAYRARDFGTSIRAFERAGGFRRGEEPYHYYMAVALYESGRYNAAKRELAAALPYIEVTPDVARYRSKINGAVE
jgi:hypothetical protein